RARTLAHPGAAGTMRITALHGAQARHLRLRLPAGSSLHAALVTPLAEHGVTSAAITLLSGRFDALDYCTPAANPAGPSVAKYSPPVHVEQVMLVAATATLGRSSDGQPLVHCHATLRTAEGI